MTARRIATRYVTLGLLISTLVLAGSVGGQPTMAGNQTADATQDQTIFSVTQGDECHTVTPVGRAWENVSAFYDYDGRNSVGTAEFQQNQASTLIIFHGTKGYSLVVVNDRYEDFGNSSYGSTATMEFIGLPESGEWVIEDDDYEDRDDEFIHRGTRSKINWKWIGGRTDGGVFRGLDTTENLDLRVVPRFNDRAEAWGAWDWSGDQNNRTEAWRLYTDRENAVQLNMNQPIRITKGPCDSSPPTAAISASATTVGVNESVTLDAGETTDDTRIVEYQWDLNGDGTVDRTSNESSITQKYGVPGEYEVGVTVRDAGDNTDTATVGITVTDGSGGDGSGDRESGSGGSNASQTTTSSSAGPGFGLVLGSLHCCSR